MKRFAIRALGAILPPKIKKSLMHLSYHIAQSEFIQFAHTYCLSPSMPHGLAFMRNRGFNPKTVIDVGAFEGGWSSMARSIWPESDLVMIEANLAKKAKLTDVAQMINATLHFALLGSVDGATVNFNIMETGSSIMSEHSSAARTVEKRVIKTLDALPIVIQRPCLLKIDAQGYEIEILRGASGSLSAIDAILLEVALIEVNEGAPLLHSVVAFMKERKFVACDVLEIHRRPLDLAVAQVDLMFVREDSPLRADRRFSQN